jgi:hypothetical protein
MTDKIVKFNEEKHKRMKFNEEQRMITGDGTKISVTHVLDEEGIMSIRVLKVKED